MSPIEQSIKKKIEAVGTPLKDWDINIYRGILTGYNDAFIITTSKRDEILSNCQNEDEKKRTAELIRPILRGRDIKRYGYNWAELWLINTHNGVKGRIPRIRIEEYPAIKAHLDNYWSKIKDRADQGDTPYNLRNCAYLEDFFRPKILYPDIMRLPRNKEKMDKYPYFYYDTKNFFPEATLFLMVGDQLSQVYDFLCSEIGFFIFSKYYMGPVFDSTGFRYKKDYLCNLPVPKVKVDSSGAEDYEIKLSELLGLSREEMDYIHQYKDNLLL